MKLKFKKYHGAGNDFIMLDESSDALYLTEERIAHICDRHFGIGADGLIRLQASPDADFHMRYYNSDGKESSMCGNGGRCITAFALDLGLVKSHEVQFTAIDGIHHAKILGTIPPGYLVSLKMKDVSTIIQETGYMVLNTGSPHYVTLVGSVADVDVRGSGSEIRYSPAFASEGINVDFIQALPDGIKVRTYERGVENETRSCGTGVVASALCATLLFPGSYTSPVKVSTTGGDMSVSFRKSGSSFSDIWLDGPAMFVFTGEIEV